MKRSLALVLLLASAVPALADIDPIYPARAVFRADPGVVRVTLEVNAPSWEVPAPERIPLERLRRQTADYLRTHFLLSVAGRPLEPRVLGVRTVFPLWQGEEKSSFLIRLAYDLPPSGRTVSIESDLFREEWSEVEAKNVPVPSDVTRDFRTFVRWSPGPGGAAVLTLKDPRRDIPWASFERSSLRRWGESAVAGVRAFFSVGGGTVLLVALLLFVPGLTCARGGAGVALVLAGVGPFLPWGTSAAERVLWAAVVAAGIVTIVRRRPVTWLAAAWSGAPAAARLWVLEGRAARDATEFHGFSWVAFAAGIAFLFASALPIRSAAAAAYRRHFRHLTPEELSRQAMFHRQVVARLLAIAGLYWVFSPLWTTTQ